MKITLGKPWGDKEDAIDDRGFANAVAKMKTMPADKTYDQAFLNVIGEDHNEMLNIIQTEMKHSANGRLSAHLKELYTKELQHRNRALQLMGKKPPAAS
jgi:hypothetical protein